MIKKLRKGELKFYLGYKPFELAKYAQEHPENAPYIQYFISRYKYNYSKMKWVRRPKGEIDIDLNNYNEDQYR